MINGLTVEEYNAREQLRGSIVAKFARLHPVRRRETLREG